VHTILKVGGHAFPLPILRFHFAPQPLLHRIAHGLAVSTFHPRHERTIEFEMIAAFLSEEAPDVLRIAIGFCDRRLAGDGIAVPVECLQAVLQLTC
jgi:hypothetical protein